MSFICPPGKVPNGLLAAPCNGLGEPYAFAIGKEITSHIPPGAMNFSNDEDRLEDVEDDSWLARAAESGPIATIILPWIAGGSTGGYDPGVERV